MKKAALQELHSYANPQRAIDAQRYFKTGAGEYGEGDIFIGITSPDIRTVVKKYRFELSLNELQDIISSQIHEERLFALLVLVSRYKAKKITLESKEEIYQFYIDNRKYINNWDLVDVSAPHIVGVHLLDKDRSLLYQFAKSDNLWEKRLSIISTFAFINSHQFDDTLAIADILLEDTHDLIHKAVGWAVRNVGIKNLDVELEFLKSRYKKMPRTMLRYAIEKFEEPLRVAYLNGEV